MSIYNQGFLSVGSKEIEELFGISRQRLSYWRRRAEMFFGDEKTTGGHYRYNFQDVVALKTIKTLNEKGFSTQHIKKVYSSLKNRHKDISNPFVQKSILLVGNRIAYKHNNQILDAITGQAFFIEVLSSEEIEYKTINEIDKRRPELLDKFRQKKTKIGFKTINKTIISNVIK